MNAAALTAPQVPWSDAAADILRAVFPGAPVMLLPFANGASVKVAGLIVSLRRWARAWQATAAIRYSADKTCRAIAQGRNRDCGLAAVEAALEGLALARNNLLAAIAEAGPALDDALELARGALAPQQKVGEM